MKHITLFFPTADRLPFAATGTALRPTATNLKYWVARFEDSIVSLWDATVSETLIDDWKSRQALCQLRKEALADSEAPRDLLEIPF